MYVSVCKLVRPSQQTWTWWMCISPRQSCWTIIVFRFTYLSFKIQNVKLINDDFESMLVMIVSDDDLIQCSFNWNSNLKYFEASAGHWTKWIACDYVVYNYKACGDFGMRSYTCGQFDLAVHADLPWLDVNIHKLYRFLLAALNDNLKSDQFPFVAGSMPFCVIIV